MTIKSDILPPSGAGNDGTDTLVNNYKKATPGQNVKTFRSFVREMAEPYTGSNGFYAWVNLSTDSLEDIITYFPELKFTPTELLDLHVTVMYSKTAISVYDVIKADHKFYTETNAIGVEYWDGHNGDGYLVVKVESSDLQQLHNKWKQCGAVPTFEDYTPHMTLKTPFKKNDALVKELNDRAKNKPLNLTLIQEQVRDLKQ